MIDDGTGFILEQFAPLLAIILHIAAKFDVRFVAADSTLRPEERFPSRSKESPARDRLRPAIGRR